MELLILELPDQDRLQGQSGHMAAKQREGCAVSLGVWLTVVSMITIALP